MIHPTAIVETGAQIGVGCRIGPYCVVGPDVVLGGGCVLHSHVVIDGDTHLGEGCEVFPFASLGSAPQDLKYAGEPVRLRIGARNKIREHVTMNPGTAAGGSETRVGAGGLYMMSSHVGHDCAVGDGVILANNVALGGHVRVQDNAIVGGNAAIHQWVRVGQGAMVGGMTGVTADVIPFGLVTGNRGDLQGLNVVGLRRRGTPRDQLAGVRAAYAALFEGEGTLRTRAEALAGSDNPLVATIVEFILAESDRHFATPEGA